MKKNLNIIIVISIILTIAIVAVIVVRLLQNYPDKSL